MQKFIEKDIALFDLDQTLIKDDSDHLWGEFLCQNKMVEVKDYREKNDYFFEAYKRNEIDVDAYLKFCLSALKNIKMQTLIDLRKQFIKDWIIPITSKAMKEKITWHRAQNHHVIIITSTQEFITRPIADLFEVEDLIATRPEIENGAFTGNYLKPACFSRNKIILFKLWLEAKSIKANQLYAYSDSINDLPLLQYVDIAIAVNPDEKLRQIASHSNWQVIDWL